MKNKIESKKRNFVLSNSRTKKFINKKIINNKKENKINKRRSNNCNSGLETSRLEKLYIQTEIKNLENQRNIFDQKPIQKKARSKLNTLLLISVISFILSISFTLAIPDSITLQGKLTDLGGSPQFGIYNMTFRIYDAYTGGNIIYQQEDTNISTDANGIYDIILDGILTNFTGPTYLGITVGTDGESTPRINLTSNPYSFRSNISDTLNPDNEYDVTALNITNSLSVNYTLFVNGSRVGVGTDNPSHLFTIRGADWVHQDPNGNGVGQFSANGDETWSIFNRRTGIFGLGTDNTQNMLVIASGGLIGIGQTSPNVTLGVSGDANITGTIQFPSLVNCDTIDTDATGNLQCGSDSTIGGGAVSGDGSVGNISYWTAANGLGNSTLFQSNGLIAIGSVDPQATLNVIGNILFNGTVGSTPTSGAGTRFMWIPEKAAIRAGNVSGGAWNDEMIGPGSAAFGADSNASGMYSMAWGDRNKANGTGATSWGILSDALGLYSTAWGSSTWASEYSSTAWGDSTNSEGQGSTAWGINSFANGSYSTVWGESSQATAEAATAWGIVSYATGLYSTAFGTRTRAAGQNSIAAGEWVEALADNSITFGRGVSNTQRLNNTHANSMMVGFNDRTPILYINQTSIGINTSDPKQTLVVVGTANITKGLNVTGGIRVSELATCTAIETDAEGNFICGTDDTIGGGSVVGDGNAGNISYWTAANGLGNSTLFQSNGLIGIGTTDPQATLEVRGSALFNGTDGATPTSGPGQRFMWIPEKAALRAGNVTSGHWDDAFIGNLSVAFGYNTNATASYSMAWGNRNKANDSYATAWGGNNLAGGQGSTAWGEFSQATDYLATAWGFDTRATTDFSTAFGYLTFADAFQATSWGFGTQAKDTDATAFGRNSYAGGQGSTAWGFKGNATGDYATAFGSTTEASDYATTAWGDSTRATQDYATAWGLLTTASGDHSTAFGQRVNASGAESLAAGEFLDALADNTIVLGRGVSNTQRLNHTQANSMVVGFNSVYPTLFVNGSSVGINTTSPNQELVVVGTANITKGLNVSGGFRVSELASCDTIDTDADGNFRCGTDNTVGGGAVSGDGSVGNISYWTDSNTIGNSTLFQSGGNIGIGTTNPGSELQVIGKVNSTSLEVNNTLFVNGSVVGIGTNTPSGGLLEVAGDVRARFFEAGGAGYNGWYDVLNSGNTAMVRLGTATSFFLQNKVGIGTDTPSSELEVIGNITIPGTFYINNNTQRLGIGVDTPITKLHLQINDTNNFSTTNILTLDHALQNTINSTGGVGLGIQFRASNNVSSLEEIAFINATLVNSIDRNETSRLGFYLRQDGQNLTEVLALNTTTTDITGKLLVSDGVNITGGARISELSSCTAIETDGDGNFICGTDDTTGGGSVVGDGSVGNISYWTDSNTIGNSTLYQSGGNIGIGTTDPQYYLQVGNKSKALNVSNTLFVNGSGRVGIGTSDPQYPFHSVGAFHIDRADGTAMLNFNNAGAVFDFNPEASGFGNVRVRGDTTILLETHVGSDRIAFGRQRWYGLITATNLLNVTSFIIQDYHNNTDFVVGPTGMVGVGTPNPTTTLHLVINDTNNFSTTNILTLDHALVNATNSTGGVGLGIQFRASNNVSSLEEIAFINATLVNSIDRNETSVLKFYTRTDGQNLTEVLALNTTTTDITGKLLVSDGANITGGARISELSSCTAIETDSDGNLICGVDDTTGGGSVVGDGQVGNITYWVGANQIGNSTIAQSNGNIGIGTTTPATTFEVQGTTNLSNDDTYFQVTDDGNIVIHLA